MSHPFPPRTKVTEIDHDQKGSLAPRTKVTEIDHDQKVSLAVSGVALGRVCNQRGLPRLVIIIYHVLFGMRGCPHFAFKTYV